MPAHATQITTPTPGLTTGLEAVPQVGSTTELITLSVLIAGIIILGMLWSLLGKKPRHDPPQM